MINVGTAKKVVVSLKGLLKIAITAMGSSFLHTVSF